MSVGSSDASSSVWLFTVPDSAVESTVRSMSGEIPEGAARVHCAGALGLGVLGAKRRGQPRGSLHPLCAVSDSTDDLSGYSAAIDADTAALRATLGELAGAVGLRPFVYSGGSRGLYHAGAVLGAGGVVALLSSAARVLSLAGVPERRATEAVLSLAWSALRRIEKRGFRKGLTGPVVRGDGETIERHLGALRGSTRELYRLLTERMEMLRRGR